LGDEEVKKLVLILFIVLLADLVSADPMDMSGQIIFAMTHDAENGVVNQWYSEGFVNLKTDVTEETSMNAQIQASNKTATDDALKAWTLYMDDFYVQQNLGAVLGLDPEIGEFVYRFGWTNTAATNYTLTNYEYENVSGQDAGSMSTLEAKLTVGGGPSVLAWFNPAGVGAPDADTNPPRFGANVVVPLGPINTSAWYYTNGPDDPKIGGSVGLGAKVGEISLNGTLNASMIPADSESAKFGTSARIGYSNLIGLGANLQADVDGLQKLGLEVDSNPIPWFGIMSGVAFNMHTSEFDNAELGAWVKADAVKVRFGYMVTDTGAAMGSMYTSAVPMNGGAWVKCYLSF
jgi:hypothetical protein